MINIIVQLTPNYKKSEEINTVNKSIDVVRQFKMLYHSINKNWKFDYAINVFCNENYDFSKEDRNVLASMDINLQYVAPDYGKSPFMVRCNALSSENVDKGSHRLLLDCDTIALKTPNFDLSKDWQAMFANGVCDKRFYDRINKVYGYNLDLSGKVEGKLFEKYMAGNDYRNFFPHYNGGAFLISEEVCKEFSNLVYPSYRVTSDRSIPKHIRHIGVQYGASFALKKISNNWKPFDRGFNYLAKELHPKFFNSKDISLLHYCGKGGFSYAKKHFFDEICEFL